MPRSTTKSKKSASGAGNIRKKTVTRDGKPYTYWEARFTVGYDPSTGKQIQRSITGKTQKEVAQKLREVTTEIDHGTYQEPCKMTVTEWMETWMKEFLVNVKPRTRDSYRSTVKTHIEPALGAIRLDALDTLTIQRFYNRLSQTLSPKTVKNVHGVLHRALQQAVVNKLIWDNPTLGCSLPKGEKKPIQPLSEKQISDLLKVVKGKRFEHVIVVTLFTGMREGEVLGLTWDCVNLETGAILINKQLQRERGGNGAYHLVSTKNGKGRLITAAPSIVAVLQKVKAQQEEWQKACGDAWQNEMNLVFTDEAGRNLSAQTVYLHFKKFAEEIGAPEARFHDLRHSYAVAALRSGADIKSVQGNLGHATASFTLDVYAHFTQDMRQDSADRMERFIHTVEAL